MKRTRVLPLLVIVSGPPAVGKTTLACLLAKRYGLPLFAKDAFKEMMYDNMQALPSLEESRFLGKCSIDTLQLITRELLGYGISHIIEANFDSELFSPVLQAIAQECSFACVQIQMECDGATLAARFRSRAALGIIHPGHQGLTYMERMLPALMQGKGSDINIPSMIIRIDTTNEKGIHYQPVFTVLDALLQPIATEKTPTENTVRSAK